MGEDFPGDRPRFFGKIRNEQVGAKELRFVSGFTAFEFGDIDNDLIHCDATEERAQRVVEQNMNPFSRKRSRVAVAITESQNGSFGFALQDGPPIGNAVSLGQIIDDGNTGFESHDRGQDFLVDG